MRAQARRPVGLASCGVVAPSGSGLPAFLDWWRAGRPSRIGPITTLREPWLPATQAGEIPAWNPRSLLPDRKQLKVMTLRVQYGVAAAIEAWGGLQPAWPLPPPERRGCWVGCGVTTDEDWTFKEAIEASIVEQPPLAERFDMGRFGGAGQDLLNPLWLVKSLTNNVLAFAAKDLDLQGANDNLEAGAAGPLLALAAASDAVADGRLDVALAGGADSLVTVEDLLHLARHRALLHVLPSQGAAFVRIYPSDSGHFGVLGWGASMAGEVRPLASPTGSAAARVSVGLAPPHDVDDALGRASAAAWAQVPGGLSRGALLRGPRLPGGPGDIDLWRPLGDPGAGAGALLLAAAWALRQEDGQQDVIELQAAGPSGEAVSLLLGTLP